MRWNCVLLLIKTTITQDKARNQIEVDTHRKVYVNERSMQFSEKVAAGIDDYSRLKMFELMTLDYEGEEKLEYENVEYDIIDCSTKGDRTFITARKIIGNVD